MSPFAGTDVPLVISLNYGQFLFNSGSSFSEQAGSSSNIPSGHDKQWLSRLRDWKATELKLPKLLRAASSKKSKTVSAKGRSYNLPPPPETVASIFTANYSTPSEGHSSSSSDHGHSSDPSVPREISPFPIPNDSASVFDPFPLDLKFKPSPLPTISERHSSSSSDYGHSYRSRSPTGPSVYRSSDPSFPYPLLYESLESKPNNHRYLVRQSSGSWNSRSPLIPEVNRPPSPECDPSALGIDQFQTHRDKEWSSRLFDWKTPGLKLPKLPHPASSRKSGKRTLGGVEITISRTVSTSEAVNNLPPPPDTVASIFTADYSSSSERPSSSLSDYGHSHRSRSSSGPSIYRDSEPSFPYPLLYESPESKPNDQERQSSSPRSSIPPPIPELDRPPSADYGPTLGVDQFQNQSNAISARFVKLGEGGAQLLPEPNEKDNGSPMVETKAVHDISTRGPQQERQESQSSEPPRSILWPPPSTCHAFSPRDSDAPFLAKIDALRSRPRKGGVDMPLNPNKKDTVQTKDLHGDPARRQAAIANPFPFPFTEDSDDETEAQSHSSVFQNVGKYTARNPFLSQTIEDDWG